MAAGLAGTTLLGVIAVASPPAQAQDVPPGKGDAYAQGVKVDPQNGQLSFGITYGQALSGHQNIQAIAEARSLDLGVIGVTLAAEGCDGGDPTLPAEQQPQPLVSRTDQKGGSKSKEELGVQRTVNAIQQPFAKSTAVVAGLPVDMPFALGPATSTTTSGVVDGRRIARAVSEVVSIGIPDVLEITGMRWVAEYQTEPEEKTITRFTIEGIEVANTSLLGELGSALGLPLLNFDEPIEQIDQINELLDPLGISIHLPEMFVESGVAFVQPLKISIAPKHDLIGELFSAIQPVREEVTKALLEMDCSNGTYITVADIVLGAISGAGALNLELGGVTATSGDIDIFKFPDLPNLSAPPALPDTPPSFSGPSVPNTTATSPPVTAPPTTEEPTDEVAAPEAEPVASRTPFGVRGGALLGVGLGALALLAVLAEGDRRKMRKAQNSAPVSMSGPDGGAT